MSSDGWEVEWITLASNDQKGLIVGYTGNASESAVVILGAHLDSINSLDVNIAPGADDNASGIATMSEVARVFLASGYRPKRTVQFMSYAAEEVGLRPVVSLTPQDPSFERLVEESFGVALGRVPAPRQQQRPDVPHIDLGRGHD